MADPLVMARASRTWLRWRAFTLCLIAIIAAALTAQKLIDTRGVLVVVATRTVANGHAITPADVSLARVLLPGPALRVTMSRIADVIGRRTSTQLTQGEPVTSTRLIPSTQRADLASVAIPIADSDVALLSAGARIDVYAAGETSSRADSVLVAHDIQVEAVNRSSDRFSRTPASAVLLVDSKQAARVAAHAADSHLTIALLARGSRD